MKNFKIGLDKLSDTSVKIELTTVVIKKSTYVVNKNEQGQYIGDTTDMCEALKKVGIDFDDRNFYEYEGEITNELADWD